MTEYRVTALRYLFGNRGASDRFENAASQSGALGNWTFTLEAGALKAVPSVEFRDREAAKEDLEPHLRDWEQAAFLRSGYRISFDYDRADVEAIDPVPGSATAYPETARLTLTAFSPTVLVGHSEYPPPDPAYKRTPLTDVLIERLRRVRNGEAEFPAAFNFVREKIEVEFGGSRQASAALSIAHSVLDALARLTARADPDVGRKGKGDTTPLTAAERAWMEAVVPRIIRRVGERAAGANLTPITMADFPRLK